MVTDFFEPLDDVERAALRAAIERDGVLHPILVDQHGNVIDGHHRNAIAMELGVECPRAVLSMTEDEALEHAIGLNVGRRQMTRKTRKRLITHLAERGWTQRRIAEVLGVDQSTVSRGSSPRDASASRPRRVDSAGRAQMTHKPTPAEIEQRRGEVERLLLDGWGARRIAKQLDVSETTVYSDAQARGRSFQRRAAQATPKPQPPSRPREPRHRMSGNVHALEGAVRQFQNDNLVAQLAFDCCDAYDLGDHEWLDRARMAARDLSAYAARVQDTVASLDGARAHREDRDDLPAEMRAAPTRRLRAIEP